MNTHRTKPGPGSMMPEACVSRAEACLADYWRYRNSLLDQYGKQHFFDLDRVIPEETREKLSRLMDRYIEQTRKEERGAA